MATFTDDEIEAAFKTARTNKEFYEVMRVPKLAREAFVTMAALRRWQNARAYAKASAAKRKAKP